MKLTSKRAFKVVKYLLENPETNQSSISKDAGVAYSWVNEVINFLYDVGIVSKGWRRCKLEDAVRLLEMIAFERPLNRLIRSAFRLETASIVEGERSLKEACEMRGIKYALTVFSGLRRFYEYYITYPSIHAYASSENVENSIPHGEGPITLFLLSPDHSDILEEAKMINGSFVCSPTQIAIDLFCSGVGRDAAVKLIEMITK